ncbi:MAG: alkyl sulfatase dimerization domain-containing protein, partial [Limnobacter sp.]|nr:alkyl sulfatase dimerization domain-containing protein [Limnobacter sp.]
PTIVVNEPEQRIRLDGLMFEFMNVPGSEAPSEFVFNVPELKLFGAAELFSHTLHNLYTLRGAKVRDALKWVDYMNQAMVMSKDAEVVVFQHNWPVWGREEIVEFTTKQRDVYKFIHDQTVRMINAGYTPIEIAERVRMPEELDQFFSARGFYGTLSHNIKAVYQFYMGWYDANPANLNPIEPVEAAKRYVELAGGMDKLLSSAQDAFDAGDYRWASELLKHAVYADPDHDEARELAARSFEQMGYVAESGPWRNVYLSGARELRGAEPKRSVDRKRILGLLEQTPLERFFEVMGASLNAERAAGENLIINFTFSDLNENYVFHVNNSVLNFRKAPESLEATATLTLTKPFFLRMMVGDAGPLAMLISSETDIEGSLGDLRTFFGLLDQAEGDFALITP